MVVMVTRRRSSRCMTRGFLISKSVNKYYFFKSVKKCCYGNVFIPARGET